MNDKSKIEDRISFKTGKAFSEGLLTDVNMHLKLFDKYGKLKDERFVHNTVTTAGKVGVADQILAAPSLPTMGWMAIGTGAPTTSLGTEVARVAFTSKTRTGAIITVTGNFAAGIGSGTIIEAGTFDADSAGNCWMNASFDAINKSVGDSLAITWQLNIT